MSFTRRAHGRVAELSYSLGGEELGHVRCDGLVAATPAGSTGYNLANSGPILAWGVEGYVVSFISPHTLTARALVAAPSDTLHVSNARGREPVEIALDGQRVGELASGDEVDIRFRDAVARLAQAPGSELLPPHARAVRAPGQVAARRGRSARRLSSRDGANPSAPAATNDGVLHELRIENLLLIERAELRLGPGLNAITGETGAGKTVLAHSLDLLMGGRARPQIVRPGADEAWVEGVFEIPEGLLDDPELAEIAERLPEGATEITLGRRVGSSGRTSAFVAGRSASAGDLQLLGSRLLAFYGQHEHRKLTLSSAQLEILDGFAGPEHLAVRREYRDAHREVVAISGELAELRDREGARERDLDLLRFELSEIEAAAPEIEEERELAAERERLRHAEGLRQAAGGALEAIQGADEDAGAEMLLAGAQTALAGPAGVDEELDALAVRANALVVELDDLGAELRSYLDRIEAEPGRLEVVEERLTALDRLQRKHGGSIEAVLEHAERCREEIERLANAGELEEELERRLTDAERRRARAGGDARHRAPPGRPRPREPRGRRARRPGDGGGDGSRSRSPSTPTASGPREPSRWSSGSRPTRGCRSRRSATQRPAASSRA